MYIIEGIQSVYLMQIYILPFFFYQLKQYLVTDYYTLKMAYFVRLTLDCFPLQ